MHREEKEVGSGKKGREEENTFLKEQWFSPKYFQILLPNYSSTK